MMSLMIAWVRNCSSRAAACDASELNPTSPATANRAISPKVLLVNGCLFLRRGSAVKSNTIVRPVTASQLVPQLLENTDRNWVGLISKSAVSNSEFSWVRSLTSCARISKGVMIRVSLGRLGSRSRRFASLRARVATISNSSVPNMIRIPANRIQRVHGSAADCSSGCSLVTWDGGRSAVSPTPKLKEPAVTCPSTAESTFQVTT